jgi:hypothetical protein
MDETLIALETNSRYTARHNTVHLEMDAMQFEHRYCQCTVSKHLPSKQFSGKENTYFCYFLWTRQDNPRVWDDRNLKCNLFLPNEINFLDTLDTRYGMHSLCKRAVYQNQQHTCCKLHSVYISHRLQRDIFRIYRSDNNFSQRDHQTNYKWRNNILQTEFRNHYIRY